VATMTKQEFPAFAQMWQNVHGNLNFGKVYDQSGLMFVFDILEDYPLQAIQQAVKAYARQNSNAPQPSDIIKLLNMGNSRLSAYEVLSEMPRTERATVVWTPEAQKAWGKASKLKSQYSIEKCFVETYERLCKESELLNRPITWSVSLGEDVVDRTPVLEAAYAKGRISKTTLQNYLPAPRNITIEGQALITGNISNEKLRPEFKSKVSELLKMLDDADKEEKDRLNAEKLAVEQLRRDNEDKAIALLPPEQQLALRSANLERYGNEVLH
jgi:hypothetical protein